MICNLLLPQTTPTVIPNTRQICSSVPGVELMSDIPLLPAAARNHARRRFGPGCFTQCRGNAAGMTSLFTLKTLLLSFLFAFFNTAAAVAQLIIADTVIVKAGSDVVHGCFRNVVQCLFCKKGLMGCNDHIRHGD